MGKNWSKVFARISHKSKQDRKNIYETVHTWKSILDAVQGGAEKREHLKLMNIFGSKVPFSSKS
jgi:hypothetical protein